MPNNNNEHMGDYVQYIQYKLDELVKNINFYPNNIHTDDVYSTLNKLNNELKNIVSINNYYTNKKYVQIFNYINVLKDSGFNNTILQEFVYLINFINHVYNYESMNI